MQSITVQSHVGSDGILRLQIPVGVKDADLRVTVNYQFPESNGATKSPPDSPVDEIKTTTQSNGWPPGYLEKVIGSWQGDFPTLDNEGDYEKREELP